jgi:hypothetical protein
MPRDTLFLLKPNLVEQSNIFHCPECATIEGVLSYHPHVRHELDVQYVDFARPRPAVIALLGEENQGCPVLILNRKHEKLPADVPVKEANGHRFVSGPREIALVFAAAYGSTLPH